MALMLALGLQVGEVVQEVDRRQFVGISHGNTLEPSDQLDLIMPPILTHKCSRIVAIFSRIFSADAIFSKLK